MRAMATIAALVLAVAGGIYFGIASCGGYVWHKQAYFAALVVVSLGGLAVPLSQSHRLLSRALLIVGVVVGYFLSQAIAAPFYPSVPESWSMFISAFLRVLVSGPC